MRLLRLAFFLCILAALMFPTTGQAQVFSVYSDASGSSCELLDTGPATLAVYVIYTGQESFRGGVFKLQQGFGTSLVYLAFDLPGSNPAAIGRPDEGISIVLDGCAEPPALLATVYYVGSGMSSPCSRLTVVADPDYPSSDAIIYGTCDLYEREAEGGSLVINPDESCGCDPNPGGVPTPIAVSTWGAIKAQYDF